MADDPRFLTDVREGVNQLAHSSPFLSVGDALVNVGDRVLSTVDDLKSRFLRPPSVPADIQLPPDRKPLRARTLRKR